MKNVKFLSGVFAVAALGFIAACSCSNDSERISVDLSRSQGIYKVGGSVTGLSGTLVLQNNGADNLTLTKDGPFEFATLLADAAPYKVTVLTQPGNQVCLVVGGEGTIAGADATGVTIMCGANPAILSAGEAHTCEIRSGALYCWGQNYAGQLGDGTNEYRNIPTAVSGDNAGWTAVSAGGQNTCAIKSGALYCWGINQGGQLGNGTEERKNTPIAVSGENTGWTAVSAGGQHTCGIRGGALYCWGQNYAGQLGDGTNANKNTPTAVSGESSGWTAVSAGGSNTCGIKGGALYCWGDDNTGELGDGVMNQRKNTPTAVSGESTGWTVVSAGGQHVCGIKAGSLYCWGGNYLGVLGDGTDNTREIPTAVSGENTGWTAVSAGFGHTCGIRSGALYCWGMGGIGQLGTGTVEWEQRTPLAVSGENSGWTAVSAGAWHTCGMKGNTLYCWGTNQYGQLGNGVDTWKNTPTSISGSNSGWTASSVGCGIKAGRIYCWGRGMGERYEDLNTPTDRGLGDGWTKVSAGWTSCGIKSSKLYCWSGDRCSIFDTSDGSPDSSENCGAPANAGDYANWLQVSRGEDHACGISAGALYCWGGNTSGQLGDGTNVNKNTPTPVSMTPNTGWTWVSAGDWYTCGIKLTRLYCWGGNRTGMMMATTGSQGIAGRLGDGTTENRNVPTEVSGANTGWTAVSSGYLHTCGIKSGALFCWGSSVYGQLGNGTLTNTTIPMAVSGTSTGWTVVAVGQFHTCGIKGGVLFCWGHNDFGQLGDGTNADKGVPTLVSGTNTGWTAISARGVNTCGIRTGALYCWGDNTYGQLGIGEFGYRASPEEIR